MDLKIPNLLSEYISSNDIDSNTLSSLYEKFTSAVIEKEKLLKALAYSSQSVKESDSKIYKNLVEYCLNNSYFELAELFCIRLLLCNPKGWWAYNKLKYISQNNIHVTSENVEDTRKLSIELLKKYFPSNEFKSIRPDHRSAESTSRIEAFNEVEKYLANPVNISKDKFRAYSHEKIVSRKAFTLEIKNGKMWFDGFNYVVWDQSGNVIEEVSTGNCEMVDVVSKTMTPNKLKGNACLLGGRISSNYYHWMYDSIPRICIIEKSGISRSKIDNFIVSDITEPFQKDTLDKLGIDPERIYSTLKCGFYITADTIYMPSYGSNENLIRHRCSPGDNLHLLQGKWSSQFLRDEFLDQNLVLDTGKEKLVYMSRGKGNSRNFDNEKDLVDLLESKGFEIIDPQTISVVEQAKYFAKATVIIAAHGAALTNAVFCKPGTRIIEIHGPFTASCFWIVSNYMELKHYTYLTNKSRKSIRKLHGQDLYSSLEEFRLKPLSMAVNELSEIIDIVLGNTDSDSHTFAAELI